MRVVATLAVKTVWTVDLVRMSDVLEIILVAVTAVANMRNNGSQIVRCATQRRKITGRLDVVLLCVQGVGQSP
jgi:hypothetical protein